MLTDITENSHKLFSAYHLGKHETWKAGSGNVGKPGIKECMSKA